MIGLFHQPWGYDTYAGWQITFIKALTNGCHTTKSH